MSVDIDERKKAEDQLRRSEAHLAEAQRLSRTGSVGLQRDGNSLLVGGSFPHLGFDPLQGLPSREAMLQRIPSRRPREAPPRDE